TYMESGIRQLLSISLVLGWVLVDWTQGHRWRALIGIAAAALLHTSALALLVLPLLFYKERNQWPFSWSLPRLTALFGGLIVVMLALNYINLEPVLRLLPGSVGPTLTYYYLTTKSFSPMALANRLVFIVLSVALAWRVREQMSQKERFLFKLYIVGFCIYLLLMSVDLVASRMNVYFRIVEFALLPALLYRNRDLAKRLVPVVAALLVLVCGIYVKDMRAIMGFSLYYENNPIKYPYVTVLNPEALLDVRYIPIKYEPYMNQAAYGQFDFDNYYRKVQRKPSLSSPVVPY
ncbi:MAG TPA: EpsG family protein, partial [Clostridia bacterium]|nr:EpsG family protein [Clostridia bacterium]